MLDFLLASLTFISLAAICLVIAAEIERFTRGR